ncbi:hypothetical protein J4732_21925 [Serratia marcescens]|uniref:Uncharacterized protein n=1 Tax=Serratia marcescens TaxID=615 RepID=A0A939SUY7_SERMA|nr:hypothetical protein [Serratia marcescens]
MVLGVSASAALGDTPPRSAMDPAGCESLIFSRQCYLAGVGADLSCRCLIDRRAVRDEFRNNTQFSFISLLPAGGVLVSIGLHPYSLPGEWADGRGLRRPAHLSRLGRCAPLWRGEFASEATTPGFYPPTVAANFICAMAFHRRPP